MIRNADGRPILLNMVRAIQKNKDHLSDIDGLIGDGDHGSNMNKGFSLFEEKLGDRPVSLADGLFDLGSVLLNQIGGSMGPIYGTLFMDMSEAAETAEVIDPAVLESMLSAGLEGLYGIVDARPGDKTLVDTYDRALQAVRSANARQRPMAEVLADLSEAAEQGRDSTRDMVAKFGRAARLGERSRGVPDAGATSCCIILQAMAEAMRALC